MSRSKRPLDDDPEAKTADQLTDDDLNDETYDPFNFKMPKLSPETSGLDVHRPGLGRFLYSMTGMMGQLQKQVQSRAGSKVVAQNSTGDNTAAGTSGSQPATQAESTKEAMKSGVSNNTPATSKPSSSSKPQSSAKDKIPKRSPQRSQSLGSSFRVSLLEQSVKDLQEHTLQLLSSTRPKRGILSCINDL